MALSLKRAFDMGKENNPSPSNTKSSSPSSSSSSYLSSHKVKRPCLLSSTASNLLFVRDRGSHNSSSEEDSSDDDSYGSTPQHRSNRLRNQRRNHRNVNKSIIPAPLDSKLSKAVAQYSDDDDYSDSEKNNNSSIVANDGDSTDDNSFSDNNNSTPKQSLTHPIRGHHHQRSHSNLKQSFNNSMLSMTESKCRNYIPDSDFVARSRCFEYLVGAIDEAWARYCDATSYAEDEVYGYDSGSAIPQTPASTVSSDEDDGYKSELSVATSLTDYDSDFPVTTNNENSSRKMSMLGNNNRRVSEVPANVRLQQLKDRLIKAKYYLQDYVDSNDSDGCLLFWKKWDLIKYATIELVEDDDDDEVVENQIEELEAGRFSSICT